MAGNNGFDVVTPTSHIPIPSTKVKATSAPPTPALATSSTPTPSSADTTPKPSTPRRTKATSSVEAARRLEHAEQEHRLKTLRTQVKDAYDDAVDAQKENEEMREELKKLRALLSELSTLNRDHDIAMTELHNMRPMTMRLEESLAQKERENASLRTQLRDEQQVNTDWNIRCQQLEGAVRRAESQTREGTVREKNVEQQLSDVEAEFAALEVARDQAVTGLNEAHAAYNEEIRKMYVNHEKELNDAVDIAAEIQGALNNKFEESIRRSAVRAVSQESTRSSARSLQEELSSLGEDLSELADTVDRGVQADIAPMPSSIDPLTLSLAPPVTQIEIKPTSRPHLSARPRSKPPVLSLAAPCGQIEIEPSTPSPASVSDWSLTTATFKTPQQDQAGSASRIVELFGRFIKPLFYLYFTAVLMFGVHEARWYHLGQAVWETDIPILSLRVTGSRVLDSCIDLENIAVAWLG